MVIGTSLLIGNFGGLEGSEMKWNKMKMKWKWNDNEMKMKWNESGKKWNEMKMHDMHKIKRHARYEN
jgi:hypothetical protein